MDELVEEIVEILQHIYRAGTDGELPEEGSNAYASRFIALILKAVVDGMPLPGEMGRIPVYDGIIEHKDLLIVSDLSGVLIALRQEEKDGD